MHLTEFTVEGAGTFPVDMLRYDGCYPADTESAVSMARTRRDDETFHSKVRRVRLVTCHTTKLNHGITDARWRSFGWRVTEIRYRHKV
jgi:hypothetical protein